MGSNAAEVEVIPVAAQIEYDRHGFDGLSWKCRLMGKYAGRSARERTGGSSDKESVATTVHVSRATLEILRDVALAREMADIAEASHGGKIKTRRRVYTVAAVIEDLIERNRVGLENEAELVRGGPRGTPARGRPRGKR